MVLEALHLQQLQELLCTSWRVKDSETILELNMEVQLELPRWQEMFNWNPWVCSAHSGSADSGIHSLMLQWEETMDSISQEASNACSHQSRWREEERSLKSEPIISELQATTAAKRNSHWHPAPESNQPASYQQSDKILLTLQFHPMPRASTSIKPHAGDRDDLFNIRLAVIHFKI